MKGALYLGIMSGTSLDGVDIALMDFSQQPKLICADCTPMPAQLREQLSQLLKQGAVSLQQLGELDHQLGLLYADSVQHFLAKFQFQAEQIRAIGCHGQTIWHSPNSKYPFTMQIGNANLIAARTQIDTVADFRRKDMAYGGQGAPLVPAFHQALFQQADKLTAVLNIGGISNVSLLTPNQPVLGYDIGAGNALMDSWIEQHQGLTYDHNGDWAKSGQVNQEILDLLLAEPYLKQSPPKSTGRELFNLAWLKKLTENSPPVLPQDMQRTLLEFTAVSIANELTQQSANVVYPKQLLVCGGGSKNILLMQRLTALLADWQVSTTNQYGIDADYVEAAAFAWLAHQRINGLPANLPTVTGATQAISLGAIYPKD